MRKQHFLKPNHKSETVRHLISIDTETTGGGDEDLGTPQELVLGWAHYSRRLPRGGWSAPRSHFFTDNKSLWDWVEAQCRPKERIVCLAHNWSFDAQVTGAMEMLPDRGWDMGLGIIDGPPWAVTWKKDKLRLDMLDTMNWWPTKLEKIGESVGIEKGNWHEVKHDFQANKEYCYNDALIPLVAVQRWADWLLEEDLGGFSLTAASQAFRAFRHRFMTHDILIDDDEKALDLARRAYHGGRTECWQIGRVEGPLTLLDVTSMYPFVMAEKCFPTILRGRWKRVDIEEIQAKIVDHSLLCDVTIETESPAYAVVHDNRLVFPTGRFRTVLSTPEIRRALTHGEIVECHEMAFYEQAPIFEGYVDYFYGRRLEAQQDGDTFQSTLFKLLLNSLYGKFGQSGMVWETLGTASSQQASCWEVYDADSNERISYRKLGGKIQRKYKEGESRESHPAIAAHVTAEARMFLFYLCEVAGFENVFYMDTDSLLVNEEGRRRLEPHIHPDRLGALKVEKELPWAELYGPKDYKFPHVTKIKGIRKNAHVMTEPEIRDYLRERGEDENEAPNWVGRCFRQDQFRSLVGALREGETATMRIRPVVKRLRRNYQKGVVTPSGRVTPLMLGSSPSPPCDPSPSPLLPPRGLRPGSSSVSGPCPRPPTQPASWLCTVFRWLGW